jgi:hypothetical protein
MSIRDGKNIQTNMFFKNRGRLRLKGGGRDGGLKGIKA